MAKSRAQRRSKLQEDRIAEDLGGKRQSGSGTSWRETNDVRKIGQLRVEAKYTEKSVYVLKVQDLLKLRDDAIKGGLETPVMQVEFVHGSAGSYKLAVIDFKLFHNWYGFSQEKPLHLQDCYVVGKQFQLDGESAKAFFTGAIALGALGVIRTVFHHNDYDRTYAVITWDLFTTLYEASDHG